MKFLLLIIALLLPGLTLAQVDAKERLISQEEIKQVLDDFLFSESEQLPNVELRLTEVDLPEAFKVLPGRLEFQVIPAKPEVVGSRRLTLLTRVDGQIVDNQSLRVELEAMADILIAADNLRRGEIITPEKVTFQQRDISRIKGPILADDEIYGKRLKRSLRLGQPLQRKQVEFPPLVKRGERVVIQAKGAGLILTAAGEAQEDGLADETIRVENIGSRREVLCRVVASGLVTVEY